MLSLLVALTYFQSEKLKSFFPEFNLSTFFTQITDKKVPDFEEGLVHRKVKHNNATYHLLKLPQEQQKNYEVNILLSETPQNLERLVEENTLFAINASFLNKNKETIGFVRSQGKNITTPTNIKGSGYFVIEKGIPKIKKELKDTSNYETIIQSFPMIIYQGNITNIQNGKKSYRSSVAIDAQNNLYFITTSTRPLSRNRVTMHEFASFLQQKNMYKALNFDGGKSTQAVFSTQNRKYYLRNHRKINNAVTITKN